MNDAQDADQEDDRWAIPESWVWSSMGEIAEVVGGGTPPTGDLENFGGDIPWITPADLSGYREKTIARGARNITQRGLDGSGARLMPAGAVLFSSRAPIGYVAIASNPVSTNQGFKSFVLGANLLPDYVYYYLRRARNLAVARASGTTFLEISGAKTRTIPIPVAPVREQSRIVAEVENQLTRLDAGVQALRRVQAQLKRYRASVLKAACEGRLVAQDPNDEPADQLLRRILKERRRRWETERVERMKVRRSNVANDDWKARYVEPLAPDTEELPHPPRGWVWASVDQVGEARLGRQRSPKHHFGRYMRPYLRAANVFEARIDTTDIKEMNFEPEEYERYRLQDGDILLNEGQSPELLGRPAVYRGEVPGACFQNTLVRFRCYLGLYPDYALLVFRTHLHCLRFKKIAQITTNIAHLGLERFVKIEFPLPPMEDQARIVAESNRRLSTVDDLHSSVDSNSRRASRLRQSILKAAFSGKLVPQDPTDEPASVLLDRIRPEGAKRQAGAKPSRSIRPARGMRTRPGRRRAA